MFFKEVNGLRKEKYKLLSKEMSNIDLNVTIEEKNWRSQNFDFPALKNLSACWFWGATTWTLCFSSYKNWKLKVKLWLVGACEGKKRAAFVPVILSEGTFLTSVFYLNV